jgi:hypothetical protein
MYEDSIERVLEKDPVTKHIFLGALARDEVKKVKYPSCMVINNEPRSKPGGHWFALYYSADRIAYFFDSYGLPPSYYRLEDFICKTSDSWTWNKKRIQGSSEFCGLYSILFCLFISRGKERDFFSKFTNNYDKNDKNIKKLLTDFS